MTTNSEKKDKSLAEFVVIVALIGVMMAVFINFYFKNESQFTHAGFDSVAQIFNTKVSAVHAQWMMDKQPNIVYLATLGSTYKQTIPVNKAGWIDVQKNQLACQAIWQLIMEEPIQENKLAVSALEVHTFYDEYSNQGENKAFNFDNSECRYVLPDGSYFQYNRVKGKVSKVIKAN